MDVAGCSGRHHSPANVKEEKKKSQRRKCACGKYEDRHVKAALVDQVQNVQSEEKNNTVGGGEKDENLWHLQRSSECADEAITVALASAAAAGTAVVSAQAAVEVLRMTLRRMQVLVRVQARDHMKNQPEAPSSHEKANISADAVGFTHLKEDISQANISADAIDFTHLKEDISHANISTDAVDFTHLEADISHANVTTDAVDFTHLEEDISHANISADAVDFTHLEEDISHANISADAVDFTHLEEDISHTNISADAVDFIDLEEDISHANISADAVDFTHLEEDISHANILLAFSENKPSSSVPENHINNNVTKRVKRVNKPFMKRKGRNRRKKTRTRCADQPTELLEAFMCNQTTAKGGLMPKCNVIDATCGTNYHPVSGETEHGMPSKHCYETEHGMPSKHCYETGDNCLEENGDKEEGSLETPKPNTEKRRNSKTHLLKNLLHVPPPRVQTTPEEVSKAFGLKISRSGRLLVPPLSHWCNQTIAYDLDGGIIAILDGSSKGKGDNGSFNFKPPKEKNASRIRKKLCNAATECIRTPKSAKKACTD